MTPDEPDFDIASSAPLLPPLSTRQRAHFTAEVGDVESLPPVVGRADRLGSTARLAPAVDPRPDEQFEDQSEPADDSATTGAAVFSDFALAELSASPAIASTEEGPAESLGASVEAQDEMPWLLPWETAEEAPPLEPAADATSLAAEISPEEIEPVLPEPVAASDVSAAFSAEPAVDSEWVGDADQVEEFARRLERIARTLRERGSAALLAEHASDPLAALITGYILGSTQSTSGGRTGLGMS